jgi:predicted transcriptional regulator of viral defense system
MRYYEFEQRMKDFPVFTTKELKLILGKNFKRSLLNRFADWKKKGFIFKLRRGVYAMGKLEGEAKPSVLASKIYAPSYISLEMALWQYGIIPDVVSTVTSVTTRKTASFQNAFGNFSYQKIKKAAFGGYETRRDENGISYNFALPEKALVDFFYLNRNIVGGSKEQFKSYRFDDEFSGYNRQKMLKYAKAFGNKKVLFLAQEFLKYYAAG